VLEKKYHDLFFMIFFIIGVLSFLNEDTLETHVGATFFAFFYALLLFGLKDVSRQSAVGSQQSAVGNQQRNK
jgi:hypothetical protein